MKILEYRSTDVAVRISRWLMLCPDKPVVPGIENDHGAAVRLTSNETPNTLLHFYVCIVIVSGPVFALRQYILSGNLERIGRIGIGYACDDDLCEGVALEIDSIPERVHPEAVSYTHLTLPTN